MTDWQVGDLAVCVTNKHSALGTTKRLQIGKTYTVRGVYISSKGDGVGLILHEAAPRINPGFHAFLFRKVVRDKQEACEAYFVTLLKRSKVSA
jgi:hypothetical protein